MYITVTVKFTVGSEFSDCVYKAADLARRLEVDAVEFEFNEVRVEAYASAIRITAKHLYDKLFDAYDRKLTSLVFK